MTRGLFDIWSLNLPRPDWCGVELIEGAEVLLNMMLVPVV